MCDWEITIKIASYQLLGLLYLWRSHCFCLYFLSKLSIYSVGLLLNSFLHKAKRLLGWTSALESALWHWVCHVVLRYIYSMHIFMYIQAYLCIYTLSLGGIFFWHFFWYLGGLLFLVVTFIKHISYNLYNILMKKKMLYNMARKV